jgi:hypothetical protein
MDWGDVDLSVWVALDVDTWSNNTITEWLGCYENWVAVNLDLWVTSWNDGWITAVAYPFCGPVDLIAAGGSPPGVIVAPAEIGIDCSTEGNAEFSDAFGDQFARLYKVQTTYFQPYVSDLQGRSLKPILGAYVPAITVCRQKLNLTCPLVQSGPTLRHPYNPALLKRTCDIAAGKTS